MVGWLRCGAVPLVLGVSLLTVQGVAAQASHASDGDGAGQAAEPPGYRGMIESAVDEYDRGLYAEAKALFLRAHAVFPSARTLRVLGMVEFELRDYVAAVDYFRAALDSSIRPLEPEMRNEVTELLERADGFTARLQVVLQPAEASLRIDAVPQQVAAGSAIRLAAGSHLLETTAEGFRADTRRVELLGGQLETIQIRLDQLPPAVRPVRRNPWLWTGIGLVVTGAVVGTVLALRAGDTAEPSDPMGPTIVAGSKGE